MQLFDIVDGWMDEMLEEHAELNTYLQLKYNQAVTKQITMDQFDADIYADLDKDHGKLNTKLCTAFWDFVDDAEYYNAR